MIDKYPLLKKLETKITRSSKLEFNKFNETYLSLLMIIILLSIFRKRKLKTVFKR